MATHIIELAQDPDIEMGKVALYTVKMRGRNRSVPFDRQIPGALARMG